MPQAEELIAIFTKLRANEPLDAEDNLTMRSACLFTLAAFIVLPPEAIVDVFAAVIEATTKAR